VGPSRPTAKIGPPSAFLDRLQAAASADRVNLLQTHLRETLADVLSYDTPERVEPQQGFFEMGVDSLMAVEFRNRLETSLGQSLPPTLAFDFPNCQAMAEYLSVVLFSPRPRPETNGPPLRASDQLDRVLANIDQLTDDEATRALIQFP
jgi:acyl carrier protein